MNTSWKKICAIVLSLVLVASAFAGCASNEPQAQAPASQQPQSSGASEAPAAPADSGAAAEPKSEFDLNGDGVVRIGYSANSMADNFTLMNVSGFQTLLAEMHPDWEFILNDANQDSAAELTIVESYIQQECDMIIIFAVNPSGSVASVEACNAANIPCVTFCNVVEITEDQAVSVIADNYATGVMHGEFWADKLPENPKVLIMQGVAGAKNSQDRVDGLLNTLAEKGRNDIEIVDEQFGKFTREDAQLIAENWVQAYEEIDFIFSCSDIMTPAIIEALVNANRTEEVLIGSVDGMYDGLVMMADGVIPGFLLDTQFSYIVGAEMLMTTVERLLHGESPAEIGTQLYQPVFLDPQGARDCLESGYFDGSGDGQ